MAACCLVPALGFAGLPDAGTGAACVLNAGSQMGRGQREGRHDMQKGEWVSRKHVKASVFYPETNL